MSLWSISGLVSGIDTQSLIDQIIAFESRPIDTINAKIEAKNTLLDAFSALETKLSALKVDLQRLTEVDAFRLRTVEVSDESTLSAQVTSAASTGTYTLGVQQLAQSHQVATQGYANTDDTSIGTGTFSIRVGSRSWVDITIDNQNSTLAGLADAINQSVEGVTASIINSGDPNTPYRLLLTATDTGSDERIVIDSNLAGGTTPDFGTVDPVVPGSMAGTSTVSSSGTYTGDSDGTITFTVQSGGTVGTDTITIDYTDGGNLSGTLTIPTGYTAGDEIEVSGGLKLSFSSGTLVANDTFSVDVTTSSIQAPLDAVYTLGSGSNAITLTSSSNTITDLVEGLTVELHSVSLGAVALTIAADTETIKDNIESFVEQYNNFVSYMNDMFNYDQDTGVAGDLLGDWTAMELDDSVRGILNATVEGLGGFLDNLVELGISTSSDGTLVIDYTTLASRLENDLEAVAKLFMTYGETTDPNIKFLVASSATVPYSVDSPYPNGYQVIITRAAERAMVAGTSITAPSAGTPLVIDSSNDKLKLIVDGKQTAEITVMHGAYTSGSDLAAQLEEQINNDPALGAIQINVRYVDDGGGYGHFEFESESYGANSKVQILSVSAAGIYSSIGLSSGQSSVGVDVAGTINGEAATGVGRILTGDEGNEYTEGLQLLVTLTPSQLSSQGQDQGYVKVTKGFAQKLVEYISSVTTPAEGKLALKQQSIEEAIANYRDEIDQIQARIDKKRERLVNEFTLLESMLGELQSQSDFLAAALSGLSTSMLSSIKR